MSVSQGHTLAALMPIATIQRGLTTVHVNLDSLGVEENARVSVTFENIVQRRLIFLILNFLLKQGGLPIYCCFYSCWCF